MFEENRTIKDLQADETFFLSNETAPLIAVEEGLVKFYVLTSWGQERILYLAQKGDFITGLEREEEGITFYLQAKTPARLRFLSENELKALLAGKDVLAFLFRSLQRQINSLIREMREATFYNFQARLASTLLYYHRRLQGGPWHGVLHFSHQELADLLGVSRITVTRGLNSFERVGLVKKARKRLYILDRDGLAGLAAKGGEKD